ncbi:MAG: hypothetical protein QOD74_2175, partial [Variibacter sp.]|nr:hypothetical protein [Variibacter sp.]
IADLAGPCVYARLQRCRSENETGYDAGELASWAKRFAALSEGATPADVPRLAPAEATTKKRPMFVYFIAGAKERAPAAAMAFQRLARNS